MTSSHHDTFAPTATSERGEGTTGGENGDGGPGKKNHGASELEDWMKSVEGEIKLVRSENEQMRDENKSLQVKFETLEENVKTLMLLNDKDEPSASPASDSGVDVLTAESDDTSNGADGDHAADTIMTSEVKAAAAKHTTKETAAAKQAKKKKKPKKKKKGSKVAKYFGLGGSVAKVVGGALKKKLTVGLLSLAMLIFLSIGQGVVIGGSSSPLRAEKSAQAIAREKIREMMGAAKNQGGREAPPDAVPDNDEDLITGREDKEDFWARILQEDSLFDTAADRPTTSSAATTSPAPMETSDHTITAPPKELTDESTELPTYAPAGFPKILGYMCNADIYACGCLDVLQTDYRGTISTTKTGFGCESWSDEDRNDYPNAGLEENFCRNRDPDGEFSVRAWCHSTNPEVEREYCDVPVCGNSPSASPTTAIPTSSSKPTVSASLSVIPTSSQSPTQMCQVADNTKCGCQVQLKSDYRGSMSTTTEGLECENWDAEWLKPYIGISKGDTHSTLFPNFGFEENFCRNPFADYSPWCYLPVLPVDGELVRGKCNVPECNPCSCMPPCEETNLETCGCPSALQADSCCDEEDASCKCTYLKDACRKSVESGKSMDFCDLAADECCKDKEVPNCKCNMFEQICSESPNQASCDFAADICCDKFEYEHIVCRCDFHKYVKDYFDIYEDESRAYQCSSDVALGEICHDPTREKSYLVYYLYYANGGMYWFNNTGWSEDEDIPHCDWFGITCDGDFVTEINMRNNNLTGAVSGLHLIRMTKLDLAENKLSGALDTNFFLRNRRLEHIDISENQFSGHADMMSLRAGTSYANFSNNNFTSFGFRKFNAAYETLRVLDMSNNRINQDTSGVFLNIPPNLERLFLSNNAIEGILPNPFPLKKAKHLAIADNNINGPLPDFSGSPQLMVLDLSNQKQTGMGGLTGAIPADIYVPDLQVLDLSGNKLTGPIPTGETRQLRVLDLSSNELSGSIPQGLGNLPGTLEVLDLSMNKLTGRIPISLNDIIFASVRLSGNANISCPAPLTQCTAPTFDLMNDTRLCPPERTALKAFYEGSKGPEWTIDENWLDEYESHCMWYGVKCNPANNSVELLLGNNGLSGTLSEEIRELSMLEKLDLHDNDIKGSIPIELGLLSQLSHLRLNFNSFKGNETNFGSLKHLEVIQIQSNRLSGTIPLLNLTFSEEYSFVADCGNPSDFQESLTCKQCTMCCNNQDDCFPVRNTFVQKLGFKNHRWFTVAFFAGLLIVSCSLAVVSFFYVEHKNRNSTRSLIHRPSLIDKERKYALELVGDDSVYQFFLGKSMAGWIIVLGTMALQIWMLTLFVKGAEIDLSDDKSDLVYTYKCPRDKIECENTSDLDWEGYMASFILMGAHLLKDTINGLKLTLLFGEERHGYQARARFLLGGCLLTTITVFTFYVSGIYNLAIGTTNTEVIVNSVAIIFINDIDELFYEILMAISPSWVESMSYQEEEESVIEMSGHENDDEDDVVEMEFQQNSNQQDILELTGVVDTLKTSVDMLHETLGKIQEENADMKRRLAMPQAKTSS